nr:scavenger receptor 10 [Harmonia axyridis]
MVCSPVTQKWSAFGSAFVFFISGIMLIFFWSNLVDSFLHEEFILSPNSYQYKYWMETPFDINMEVYIFNWTNSEELNKKGTKPNFEQLGPYMYAARNSRANVVFNSNKTVSFNTVRKFWFVPEKSKGSLDDNITIMNPIVMSMANVAKKEHHLIQRGIHYFMKEFNTTLAETKTANELLFEGIDDVLMELAEKLKMKTFTIPYDRFGFFYSRNGSASYDGNYTMWTGEDDIQKTGIVSEWNFKNYSDSYSGNCDRIDGSTGEVWYPVKNSKTISIFVPDMCSVLTLEHQGSRTSNGIEGNVYVATDKLFDNGVKYPETACFSPNEVLPSGVRDISKCKYQAPAYISLPHFYLADESYRNDISGMKPDPENHKIELIIEPTHGMPVEAYIAFQANFRITQVKGISMFENLKDMMVPLLWVKVAVRVPDNYAFLIKLSLSAGAIGQWIGYVFIFLSIVLFLLGVYLELRMRQISMKFTL